MPESPPSEAQVRRAGDISRPRVILAFDFGLKRIGVACGDTITRTASPLRTLPGGSALPWDVIGSTLRAWQPNLVVVGLPYNVDGSDSRMTVTARDFAAELTRRYSLTVETVDERYSSLEAESRLKAARESGLRRRRVVKSDIDATAACVILERWFTEKS
jgi:putative holliday junction resolvase